MKRHNLAFIDLETTGLNPERHEIVEIGILLVKQIARPGLPNELEVIDRLELKVKPEHLETADPEALRINGYNEAEWIFAVSLDQAMKAVAEKTAEAIMVAQNIAFDWLFLEKAFVKTGVPNRMNFRRLDLISMALAKTWGDTKLERYGLQFLCEYYGVKNDKAHTALADIQATYEIFRKVVGLN